MRKYLFEIETDAMKLFLFFLLRNATISAIIFAIILAKTRVLNVDVYYYLAHDERK